MSNSTTMKGRRPPETTGSAPYDPAMSLAERQNLERVSRYAPKRIGIFRRAYGGKSLRAAATAKCIECNAWQPAEVARCGIEGCPLWRYRPHQGRKKAGAEARQD